ncbi:MAG: hypothetical protein AAFZ18_26215 [Myxococcota bacterium]
MKIITYALPLFALLMAPPLGQAADSARPRIGDAVNGAKLFEAHCKSRYAKTGIGLFTSDQMNLLTDQQLFSKVSEGECVTSEQPAKFDPGSLAFLDRWDVVAFMRTLHMNLDDFFPKSSRYISKVYEIDDFGLKRYREAVGELKAEARSAAVFTFFDFEGEAGNLAFIPQDPIQLDQLKKRFKAGYLVFLPFAHGEFQGEIGIAMDPKGKVVRMMVHPQAKGASKLNADLAGFEGWGQLGSTTPPKTSKKTKALVAAVFPAYLRAAETVTMYVRDENERTWAD